MNVILFSKRPYLTAFIKINYKTVCIGRFSEKTQRFIQDTGCIATAKMDLFVALVSGFQLINNFTKNPNIGAMGVLNSYIKYFNII